MYWSGGVETWPVFIRNGLPRAEREQGSGEEEDEKDQQACELDRTQRVVSSHHMAGIGMLLDYSLLYISLANAACRPRAMPRRPGIAANVQQAGNGCQTLGQPVCTTSVSYSCHVVHNGTTTVMHAYQPPCALLGLVQLNTSCPSRSMDSRERLPCSLSKLLKARRGIRSASIRKRRRNSSPV